MSGFRLGVDIGGTFTDFALFDPVSGSLYIHKCLTTSDDPSRAVIDGAQALLERESVDIADLRDVVHGTTLVTNALIERKGACTGMLITEGFRDIPDMREEKRYDVFDLRITFPIRSCAVRGDGKCASACVSTARWNARSTSRRPGLQSTTWCAARA